MLHERLLLNLKGLGIGQPLLSCIQDFISGRKQRVSIKGTLSMWKEVLSGVPQSPVLFVVYVDYLTDSLQSKALLFADDVKIWSDAPKYVERSMLQDGVLHRESWADN